MLRQLGASSPVDLNNEDNLDAESKEKHKNDFYEAYRTPDNYGETIKRKKQ